MKKQYLLLLLIACITFSFNAAAQNSPIDEFLKKYDSREGVTNVSMSKQMLQSIFTPPTNGSKKFLSDMKTPDAYSSVSISKIEDPTIIFSDFKKILSNAKFEIYLEVNKEKNRILNYYIKNIKDHQNEIVIIRTEKDQFSAIYLKGDIEVSQVDLYLQEIRFSLARMGATNDIGAFQSDLQFAFSFPEFDDLKINFPDFQKLKELDFQFDIESFKQNFDESMKEVKDAFKNLEFNTDFHFDIQEAVEDAQKQIKDVQKQMEEELQRAQEKQDSDSKLPAAQ